MEPDNRPTDIAAYNRRMWDAQVERGNPWTVPVESEVIARAKEGDFSLVLTPTRPVPADWYPQLDGCATLCLASGGGQQGPILAAAGAEVTVFDNSPKQLAQDDFVAKRDGLQLQTLVGDMRDLSGLEDASFDFIFHPCSNGYVDNVLPVWREAYRVLKPGGTMIAGFINPLVYLFDEDSLEVKYKIPYADITSLSDEAFAKYAEAEEPTAFGHTLEDQIGGQLAAGFLLTGFYEDGWGPDSESPLSAYCQTAIATRALKT